MEGTKKEENRNILKYERQRDVYNEKMEMSNFIKIMDAPSDDRKNNSRLKYSPQS